MRKIIIAVAMMMMLFGNAEAEEIGPSHISKGLGFYEQCSFIKDTESAAEYYMGGYCFGFLEGMRWGRVEASIRTINWIYGKTPEADEIISKLAINQSPAFPLCNTGTSQLQNVLVFLKFLKENPNLIHHPTGYLYKVAMEMAFPCSGKEEK